MIKPKCKQVYTTPSEEQTEWVQGVFYTGTGHLLPCCWCISHNKYFEENGFYDDNLKIENVESVEDIFYSKAWIKFHKRMESDNPAPICKIKCGTKDT
jgi:hypothetical protein